MLLPVPGRTMTSTPLKTPVPPVLTQRKSANLSREERGSQTGGDFWSRRSSFGEESPGISSPEVTRKLFGVGDARRRTRMWWLQRILILLLAGLAVWSWLPVLTWLLDRRDRAHEGPHVHLFHEQRCAGESLSLSARDGAKDLCGLAYPSGEAGKDNVASAMIVGEGFELRVYGTCRLAEQPQNPMLLETIDDQGCVDLRYPLCGSVELVPAGSVEL